MVSPWWGLAAEAKTREPCWLSGALRALSGLLPLLAAPLPVLWVQPCKKTKDQAESAAARLQSGQGARLPQTLLFRSTKCQVCDLPSCLKPQPSGGWPAE